jgi:hypothetical protein
MSLQDSYEMKRKNIKIYFKYEAEKDIDPIIPSVFIEPIPITVKQFLKSKKNSVIKKTVSGIIII